MHNSSIIIATHMSYNYFPCVKGRSISNIRKYLPIFRATLITVCCLCSYICTVVIEAGNRVCIYVHRVHRFIICCSRWFCIPPSFDAVYCYICGRRRVAVARYPMLCLNLISDVVQKIILMLLVTSELVSDLSSQYSWRNSKKKMVI